MRRGQQYIITPRELLYLGVSIGIILTIIFSGIKLI
jgi:hypothetical protein